MRKHSFCQFLTKIREALGDGVAIEVMYLLAIIMEGCTYSGDIVSDYGLTRASLSRCALRLQFIGLIEYKEEGRGRRYYLTDEGEKLAEYIRNA